MLKNLFKKTAVQENVVDHMEELSDTEASSVVGGVGLAFYQATSSDYIASNFIATAEELNSQSEFAINGQFRRGQLTTKSKVTSGN